MAGNRFYGISANSREGALASATANSMIPEIKKLLVDGASLERLASGTTALHEAARLGLAKPAGILIEAARNLDVLDKDKLTPLMRACTCGKAKGSQIALLLIDSGADVRYVRKSDEMTALKNAAKNCSPEVVARLIEAGAPVDGPPGTRQTALVLAARANNVDNLKVLIQHGADPSQKCKLPWAEGRTAAGIAEMEGRKRAATYLRSIESEGKSQQKKKKS